MKAIEVHSLSESEVSLPKEPSVRKRCGDWENCVAFDPNDEECSRNNGCMTKENIEEYLRWCSIQFKMIEKEAEKE